MTVRTAPPRRPVSLGRDWRLEDRVVPAGVLAHLRYPDPGPTLRAPNMPDLADFDLSLAAAIRRAWQLPAGTAAAQWVVGLAPGEDPRFLSGLGADVYAVDGWNNTFLASFATAKDVAGFGPQLASTGLFAYPLVARQQTPRFYPNDPLFPQQWHLLNTGQTGGTVGADARVTPVWNNFTGAGVVIGIVDDGLQHTHPDLQPNYDPGDSFDFNNNDADPAPDPSVDWHGTAVAGVAAGKGNNSLGITGAAFNASIAGLRLISAAFNDSDEATALGYHRNAIDIYSNSWGPADIGSIAGPGPQTLAALQTGFTSGRGGLGNIYTWAGGNGRLNQDNVNYDGYANSRFVIAVGAIDHNGRQSTYSESGAPLLISASSNSLAAGTPGITTTDIVGSDGYSPGNYTNDFGGTSSATPLVSGVIALMLQANPALSVRDIETILARTAIKTDPGDPGWSTNAAGYHINHKYGFGAINATGAVAMARNWTALPGELQFTSPTVSVNKPIPDNNATGVSSSLTMTDNIRLEHVEVVFNATHPYRGDLEVVLTAPSGTRSVLAQTHVTDSGDDYSDWVFTTVRDWGEASAGKWTLTVRDKAAADVGTFGSWTLRIYGTEIPPVISGLEPSALIYLENQSIGVTSSLTAASPSGNRVNGASVKVSGNYIAGEDVLELTAPNGLSGFFNANSGTLAISGNGTLAQYQAALRSVRYRNLSEDPTAVQRTVSFQVSDIKGNPSNILSRKILVIPVNDAPSFVSGTDILVDEDAGPQSFQSWATSIQPGPAEEATSNQITTLEIVSYTNPGLFLFPPYVSNTGTLTFTTAPNASGNSTVSVRARDNGGTANGGVNVSAPQSFQIFVSEVNDAPIGLPDVFVVSEDGSLTIPAPGVLANDKDLEGDALSAARVSDPTHGSLSFNGDGSFTYQPVPNYTGLDTFTYEVTDGVLTSAPITVTLNVAPVNDLPTAVDDSASSSGQPVVISVAGNDTDPDGDFLQVSSYTRPGKGSISRLGNSLVYTPLPGVTGTDTFDYTISDGNGGFDTATVTVNVSDAVAPILRGVRLTYGSGAGAVVDLAALARTTLPWAGITKFQFDFSEHVSVDPAALTLVGAEGGALPLTFDYDAATHVATWSRPTGLPVDQYTLRLNAALVSDASANPLGADWAKSFAVLPGDFDGNGVVDDVDLAGIQRNFTGAGAPLNRFADINGDGVVDATDLDVARSNRGRRA